MPELLCDKNEMHSVILTFKMLFTIEIYIKKEKEINQLTARNN